MTRQPETASVVVFGSLHMDVVVRAERRPVKGETLPGRDWRLAPGGKGGNQAVHAARHGARVRMVGRVGEDEFAAPLLAYLRAYRVDTEAVRRDPAGRSGMSVAIVDGEGDYGAVIVSGVNMSMDAGDVAAVEAATAGAQALVLQYEVSMDRLAPAARAAWAGGARVMLNAAPARPPPPGLLEAVDIVVVNEVEAAMLTGMAVSDKAGARQALRTLRQTVPAAVITLGGRGVLVGDDVVGERELPAHPVDVVDTHGAGDAFIGALAHRLAVGDDLGEAARYANAAAAIMVGSPGADPAPVSPDRVRALLDGTGPT